MSEYGVGLFITWEGGGGGGLEDFGRSNGFQVEWTKDQSLPSECKCKLTANQSDEGKGG